MKELHSKSIKKYLCLILIDVTIAVGIVIICGLYSNVAYSELFSVAEACLILGVPAYLLLRGILSRIFLQRVWLPNLILFAEIWLVIICAEMRIDVEIALQGFIGAFVFFVIASVISLITGGVLRLIAKSNQQNKLGIKPEKQRTSDG